jgi:hypothetical protein
MEENRMKQMRVSLEKKFLIMETRYVKIFIANPC